MAAIYRYKFPLSDWHSTRHVLATINKKINPLFSFQPDVINPKILTRSSLEHSCMNNHFRSKCNLSLYSLESKSRLKSPIPMTKCEGLSSSSRHDPNKRMLSSDRLHDLSRVKKSNLLNGLYNNLISKQNKICFSSIHTIAKNPKFRTMEGIQSLANNPTREHIENIRNQLSGLDAKCNDNQQITLEKDNVTGVATICIKSGCKNGISAKMMSDLLDVIDELYLWEEGKGVLIYGYGGFFCSGGDLVTVKALANYEDGLKMATLMQYNLSRLQALPMITMAMIQGKAIGGGAEIAVATDLRIVTKTAKIGYVHARVGICSAWGGGSRLVQLLGPGKALEMMTSARLIDAQEAYHMGLVNHVLDLDDAADHELIMAKALDYLKARLIGAKTTIIAMKGIVNAARTLPLEQALVSECQLLASLWGKEAHLAALKLNIKHNDA